jgi:hypothetical protein
MNKFLISILSILALIFLVLMIVFEASDESNQPRDKKFISPAKDTHTGKAERTPPPPAASAEASYPVRSEFHAQNSVSNGLVAHYPFNGNANDESGNGNHGTVHGAKLTQDRFGNPNSAYYFDGIDDMIIINSDFFNSSKTITINIKFILKAQRSHFSPIIYKGETKFTSKNQPINERTYSLWVTKFGEIHLASADFAGQQHLNTPKESVILDVWYNYTGIIDREKGTIKSYLNGYLITEDKIRNNSPVINSNPLFIGSTPEKNERFTNFCGIIDEISFYDKALDQTTIINLYK